MVHRLELEKNRCEWFFTLDKLVVLGHYNISGQVLILPIIGNGKANITTSKYSKFLMQGCGRMKALRWVWRFYDDGLINAHFWGIVNLRYTAVSMLHLSTHILHSPVTPFFSTNVEVKIIPEKWNRFCNTVLYLLYIL